MLRLTVVDESSPSTRENATTWARPFTARLLEPGLVSYEDSGAGIALLKKETIDRDIHTFVGRPVVFKINERGKPVHSKLRPSNMKAEGHGYVTEVYYNTTDGWWYGRGVVDTDEAADAINMYGFASVAYTPTGTSASRGSKWHDMPYSEEITGFSGEHLAIVARPRYEEATIRLNSKETTNKDTKMFKLLKKLASHKAEAPAATAAAPGDKPATEKTATETSRENSTTSTDISAESVLDINNAEGKPESVTLQQLVDRWNAKEEDVDGESEIRHNGKTYKLNALLEAFDKWERHNAAEEEKKKEDKENAKKETATAAPAAAEAARENAKPDHFRVLSNASNAPRVPAKLNLNTIDDRLARGREMFGSPKKG